jgi:hypothetical protein
MERAPLAALVSASIHLEVRLLVGSGDAGVVEQVSHARNGHRTL